MKRIAINIEIDLHDDASLEALKWMVGNLFDYTHSEFGKDFDPDRVDGAIQDAPCLGNLRISVAEMRHVLTEAEVVSRMRTEAQAAWDKARAIYPELPPLE